MTSWCLRIGVAHMLLSVPLFAQSSGTREVWEFACHEGEKSSDHMLSADQTGN
jgi:hypothetical protein